MNIWALAALVVIFGSVVISAWKKIYFTVVASVACMIVFAIQQIAYPVDPLAFVPRDLVDPMRIYTLLTSMYAHAGLDHLLFNILGLVFIGIVFEQRIGTRPFILLYFISGLFGTLAFAGYFWNDPFASVVGASGAISGVLGGFARLYPNERMAFIFAPGMQIPAVYIVFGFVALQLVFIIGTSVAWMSHLAGLAAGILFAPIVTKLRMKGEVKMGVSVQALRKLATTPELQGILKRIESEEVPDVKKAWISHLMSKARCPICGAPIKVSGDSVRCSRGHLI